MSRPLLVVCGFRTEAEIVAGPGVVTIMGGGRVELLRERIVQALEAHRPRGALSFGVAGGLDPALSTGQLLAPDRIRHAGAWIDTDPPWRERLLRRLETARETPLAASEAVVDGPHGKSALRTETGAAAVDMESGVAAELCLGTGTPFAVLRAVADEARTALPRSAQAGLGPDGDIRPGAVAASLLRRPRDLPGVLRAGRDSALAFAALRRARAELGPDLGFPT